MSFSLKASAQEFVPKAPTTIPTTSTTSTVPTAATSTAAGAPSLNIEANEYKPPEFMVSL